MTNKVNLECLIFNTFLPCKVLDAPVPFFVGVHAASLAAAFPAESSADAGANENDPMAYLGPRRPREVISSDS